MNEEEIEKIKRYKKVSKETNKLLGKIFCLNFEKSKIKKELKEVRLKLRELRNYSTNDPIPDGLLDEQERDDSKIIVGVEVRITNPHENQLDQGIVRGFTRNGFAQIYTCDGTFIKRHPKNLRRIKRYQGLKFGDPLFRYEDSD